ncbi:MAG: hypothetical protein M1386_02235 [Candidatus Thermoplasmatota archaeon]|nr:hypothetical protein [Candidatus Thermoplasmatota archaeon]
MLDNDASTAKTLTLVAIILQLVFFAIGAVAIVGVAAYFSVGRVVTSSGGVVTTTTVNSSAPTIALVVSSIFFLIGLLWILLDYFLVYKNLALEKVKESEVPSLILGIIQLILAGVIPGILLIIAYVKIRDSLENSARQLPPINSQ